VTVETEEEEAGPNLDLPIGRTLVVLVTICLANIRQTLIHHILATVEMSVGVLEHVVMVLTIPYGKGFVFTATAIPIIPLVELVVMEKTVV